MHLSCKLIITLTCILKFRILHKLIPRLSRINPQLYHLYNRFFGRKGCRVRSQASRWRWMVDRNSKNSLEWLIKILAVWRCEANAFSLSQQTAYTSNDPSSLEYKTDNNMSICWGTTSCKSGSRHNAQLGMQLSMYVVVVVLLLYNGTKPHSLSDHCCRFQHKKSLL